MDVRRLVVILGLAVICGAVMAAHEKPPETYVKAMRAINDAVMDAQMSTEGQNWPAVIKDVVTLKTLFKTTEKFWQERKTPDAVGFSKDALKAVVALEAAAKVKDQKAAVAAQKDLNKACNACHTAHREIAPDRTYAIK